MPSPSARSVCLSGLLGAWLSHAAVGQEPEPDPARVIGKTVERQLLLEVQTRLQSKDLATIAWGGYLAAQHRVASAVPLLREALRDLPQGEHRKYAAQALMDALIVHGSKASAEDLAPFRKGLNEGASLVLASKDPAAHREFLMKMHRATKTGRFSRWLVSGNLLAEAKDREFGRYLIAQLSYELKVNVCEKGEPVGFGVGGAFGGRFGDGRFVTPLGFPPTVTYRVVTRPKVGDVLFSRGGRNAYYRRQVHHQRKVGSGVGEYIELRGRQQRRVDWLAAMLDTSFGRLPVEHSELVTWTDAKALLAEVEKARASIASRHDRIVDRAVKAGWLKESERSDFGADVRVALRDQRKNRKPALPDVK